MDEQPLATAAAETLPPAGDPTDGSNARVVYILYLIGIVLPITTLVGLVMAYVKKADAPPWVQSHYRFQVRTFWIGFLYSVVGMATSLVVIGYAILLFTLVWLVVRCIKGLGWAERGEPVRNVTSWLFP